MHWVLLQGTIPQPKKLAKRKLCGYYSHALLTHASLQYRLISLCQLNTENEEQIFGSLKDITLHTSSRRPGEITYNAFIRLQEESKHNQHKNFPMENTISKHASSLSVIPLSPKTWGQSTPHHWQALLECIADHLKVQVYGGTNVTMVQLNFLMYHFQ